MVPSTVSALYNQLLSAIKGKSIQESEVLLTESEKALSEKKKLTSKQKK
jgi:hypothetical protein